MKPDWLKEIEEREAKATKGPWRVESLSIWSPDWRICQMDKCGSNKGDIAQVNAQFIAHSRQDIKTLLQALNTAMEALNGAIPTLVDTFIRLEYEGAGREAEAIDGLIKTFSATLNSINLQEVNK